jgi:serine/threonine protein kinase
MLDNAVGSQTMPMTSFIAEQEIAEYVRQLAVGIEFMQSRGIMHRDMKLSNILLTETH